MAENIAKFLNVTALGIDVLAGDINKSWRDGNFGIIEINAGPGVFMHLAPAFGGSVDIPGYIMEHFFTKDFRKSRIPIIVGNYITKTLAGLIYNEILDIKPDVEFGCVKTDGVYFNNEYFTHFNHVENCKILFRNPKLDIALIDHDNENIHDYGTYHLGHDVAILDKANYAERILERDLMPDGILIEIVEDPDTEGKCTLVVKKAGEIVSESEVDNPEQTEELIVGALRPYLKEILEKYD
jgi:cyanophycin synthetase